MDNDPNPNMSKQDAINLAKAFAEIMQAGRMLCSTRNKKQQKKETTS